MLIKALCDYYDVLSKKELVLPEGYSEVPIRYKIALTEDGTIDEIISCEEEKREKTKSGKEKITMTPKKLLFPKRTDKSAIESNYIEHRPLYIFGLNLEKGKLTPDDKSQKAKKSHDAFVKKNLEFIEGLDSPIVNAYRNFLLKWKPEDEVLNTHVLTLGTKYSSSGFAFCLTGSPDVLLQDDLAVCRKWEEFYSKNQNVPGEFEAQCAITGEKTSIARIHGKIKGLADGATTGNVLIGFNNPSDTSYGNKQSYNSNISEKAMKKYTEALNFLLKNSAHKIILDDITVCFWAMDGGDNHEETLKELLMKSSKEKSAEEIDALLKSILQRGAQTKITLEELEKVDETLDANIDFYIVGLKPNSSRISIKFIYRKKFGTLLMNVVRFQEELQISNEINVISLKSINDACKSPKSSTEKINPSLFASVFESALYNKPYPQSILATIVRRAKTDKEIDKVKAGVIKAYLMRNEKEEMTVALNRDNQDQAYLCGRLFAVLERIQEQAAGGKLNSTIKDRYFASATSKPASVFPTLIKLEQHHLKKLPEGSQVFYSKIISEIMDGLENEFPTLLSLTNQGKFIVGYYQQTQAFYTKKEN